MSDRFACVTPALPTVYLSTNTFRLWRRGRTRRLGAAPDLRSTPLLLRAGDKCFPSYCLHASPGPMAHFLPFLHLWALWPNVPDKPLEASLQRRCSDWPSTLRRWLSRSDGALLKYLCSPSLSVNNTEAAAGSWAPRWFSPPPKHTFVFHLGVQTCWRRRLKGGWKKRDDCLTNFSFAFFLNLQLSECI